MQQHDVDKSQNQAQTTETSTSQDKPSATVLNPTRTLSRAPDVQMQFSRWVRHLTQITPFLGVPTVVHPRGDNQNLGKSGYIVSNGVALDLYSLARPGRPNAVFALDSTPDINHSLFRGPNRRASKRIQPKPWKARHPNAVYALLLVFV